MSCYNVLLNCCIKRQNSVPVTTNKIIQTPEPVKENRPESFLEKIAQFNKSNPKI